MSAHTPGTLYVVNQQFPSLVWRVVPVPEAQGQAMREREEPHVYDTAAQAYAVTNRLNEARREKFIAACPPAQKEEE
jgi:hypothetical protein